MLCHFVQQKTFKRVLLACGVVLFIAAEWPAIERTTDHRTFQNVLTRLCLDKVLKARQAAAARHGHTMLVMFTVPTRAKVAATNGPI